MWHHSRSIGHYGAPLSMRVCSFWCLWGWCKLAVVGVCFARKYWYRCFICWVIKFNVLRFLLILGGLNWCTDICKPKQNFQWSRKKALLRFKFKGYKIGLDDVWMSNTWVFCWDLFFLGAHFFSTTKCYIFFVVVATIGKAPSGATSCKCSFTTHNTCLQCAHSVPNSPEARRWFDAKGLFWWLTERGMRDEECVSNARNGDDDYLYMTTSLGRCKVVDV